MRLAAFVDVDLEAGMLLGELVEEAVERRRVLAREDGEDVARFGEQALREGADDFGEARAR